MGARIARNQKPGILSFVKIGLLWLLVSNAATIAANTVGISARSIGHFAIAGFAVHALLAVCYVLGQAGNAWRLPLGLVVCLLVGAAMRMSLDATVHADLHDAREHAANALAKVTDAITGADRSFQAMGSIEHLAAAAKLIFEEESAEALKQARRHLRAIPSHAFEYDSAQRLLDLAEKRSGELGELAPGIRVAPVQIVKREQKEETLLITLRNNGARPIKNISYDISYFEIATGLKLETHTRSKIRSVLQPHETQTIEIPKGSLKIPAHVGFALVDWETIAGS